MLEFMVVGAHKEDESKCRLLLNPTKVNISSVDFKTCIKIT